MTKRDTLIMCPYAQEFALHDNKARHDKGPVAFHIVLLTADWGDAKEILILSVSIMFSQKMLKVISLS